MSARYIATLRRTAARQAVASGDAAGDERLARSLRLPFPWLPGMGVYVAARTEFFDSHLLHACERGVRQVVLVGAGYDGRSIRFRQPGITFFEVDLPATQADKRARMEALAIDASDVSFVPLDIQRRALAEALTAAGHDPSAPTFFMCEGVSMYLPRADLQHVVESLASVAGSGSSLAIDFATPRHHRSLPGRVLVGAVRAGTAVMGERVVTFLTVDEARALLSQSGWPRVELVAPRLAFPALFALAAI
jgi:methyltransferase (TIGR00027 family)